jgi:hypothetical protein
MALYRKIHFSFWEDTELEDYTPEEKYFYLYLLTNPHTQLCGIYEISIRQMALETGFDQPKVIALLARFEGDLDKIRYNKKTKELAIRNWLKYNDSSSPKTRTAVETGHAKVKDKTLIAYQTTKNTLSKNSDTLFSRDKGEQEHKQEQEQSKSISTLGGEQDFENPEPPESDSENILFRWDEPDRPTPGNKAEFTHNDFRTKVIHLWRQTHTGGVFAITDEQILMALWKEHGTSRMLWGITHYAEGKHRSIKVLRRFLTGELAP